MKLCIVVPVYNEAATIEQNIASIIPYAQALPSPATVVAVNDGSKDHTETILLAMAEQYPHDVFQVISYPNNRGYGGALKAGGQFATAYGFDYVLFMDSDLTNHPKYLAPFYAKMTEGCEYIKATRYGRGGGIEGVSWKRRAWSRIGSMAGGILFRLPLTDVTNGFRAMKTSIFDTLDLQETGFPMIMEELAQAKRCVQSFGDVPYILTARTKEQGTTHFSYSSKTLIKYLSYSIKGACICWKQKT